MAYFEIDVSNFEHVKNTTRTCTRLVLATQVRSTDSRHLFSYACTAAERGCSMYYVRSCTTEVSQTIVSCELNARQHPCAHIYTLLTV